MSNRKPQSRKSGKAAKQLPREGRGSWITRLSVFWKTAFFLLGLPGLYVGVLSILPRVSVSNGDELKNFQPFSAPFVIANDGLLSIYSVTMYCLIDHLVLSNRSTVTNSVFLDADSGIEDEEIGPDGRSTHFCPSTVYDPGMQEVIMTAVVHFRPAFLPWKTHRQFSFKGHKSDDGVMHWSPYTRDKNWF